MNREIISLSVRIPISFYVLEVIIKNFGSEIDTDCDHKVKVEDDHMIFYREISDDS